MGKILIVDDSNDIIDSLYDLLSESGHTVYSENSAVTGHFTAERIIPDLILCDILMPKNDGYDFLKMITSNKTTASIPIIFISARAEKTERIRAMLAGASDYITKPYDGRELLNLISKVLNERITSLDQKDIAD